MELEYHNNRQHFRERRPRNELLRLRYYLPIVLLDRWRHGKQRFLVCSRSAVNTPMARDLLTEYQSSIRGKGNSTKAVDALLFSCAMKNKRSGTLDVKKAQRVLERLIQEEGLTFYNARRVRAHLKARVKSLKSYGAKGYGFLGNSRIRLTKRQQTFFINEAYREKERREARRTHYKFSTKGEELIQEAIQQNKELGRGGDRGTLVYSPFGAFGEYELRKDRREVLNELNYLVLGGVARRINGHVYEIKNPYFQRQELRKNEPSLHKLNYEEEDREHENSISYKSLGVPRKEIFALSDELALSYGMKKDKELSAGTKEEYLKVLKRLESQPLIKMADYLKERRSELSKTSWWKEHAVIKRMLVVVRGGSAWTKLDRVIEDVNALTYGSNAKRSKTPQHEFHKKGYEDLLKSLYGKDQALHDYLVVLKETGARPEEVHKGIELRPLQGKDAVKVSIIGAKKRKGSKGAKEARYRADAGSDRTFIIVSSDLRRIAERHNGYFKPQSTKDALRVRFNRKKKDVPLTESLKLSTFRHLFKEVFAKQYGEDRLAEMMGHQSNRTQKEYGNSKIVL